MKLGIGSYTYTWAIGVPGHIPPRPMRHMDLLIRARDLGVNVVQFADNLPLAGLQQNEIDDLADFAAENMISVELGTRGIADEANLLRHLELAQFFEAPFVRVVVDSAGHEPSPGETVSRLRPMVRRFADGGIKLAIENHDRFSSASLAQIVEELGTEHVGICLDTVNSFGAMEGPEVVVRTLAPYTLNLHVKDFTIRRVPSQMGFVVSGSSAGTGRLNVPWLLQTVKEAGARPNAILELWTPWENLEKTIQQEAAWVEESVSYMRRFLPE